MFSSARLMSTDGCIDVCKSSANCGDVTVAIYSTPKQSERVVCWENQPNRGEEGGATPDATQLVFIVVGLHVHVMYNSLVCSRCLRTSTMCTRRPRHQQRKLFSHQEKVQYNTIQQRYRCCMLLHAPLSHSSFWQVHLQLSSTLSPGTQKTSKKPLPAHLFSPTATTTNSSTAVLN